MHAWMLCSLAKWPFKAFRQANSTVATKPCQPLTDDIEMIHFGGTEIYENWKISQLPHQEVCWRNTINKRVETLVMSLFQIDNRQGKWHCVMTRANSIQLLDLASRVKQNWSKLHFSSQNEP